MTDRISLAAMGSRQPLDSGAQGKVFAAPGLRMQYAPSLVYKQYQPEVAATLDVPVLESMPAYLESLPFGEGMELLSMAAWPCRLVEDDGAVTGFVMPAIPDAFFLQLKKSSGTSREAAEFQHLLNDEGFLARRGISLSDRNRYELLREAARALTVLHRHDIAVGDLSPKNLLFTLAPDPGVYFIDCDSMRIKGRSAMKQAETPGWRVRDRNPAEELATTASDSYKLGLLALRLLTGTQDAHNPGRLPPAVPPDIRQLTTSALAADPAHRPRPAEWTTPLQAATRTAATRPPQATSSTPTQLAPPPPPEPATPRAPSRTRPAPRVPPPSPPHAHPASPPPRRRTRRRAAIISAISLLAITGIILLALANLGTPQSRPPAATLNDPFSFGVNAVAFSPDGTTLATADGNDSTYLWNTTTRKITATLNDPDTGNGSGNGVSAVAFSPDGTTLATADANGSTYLWDIATRKITATLTVPHSVSSVGVKAVAFSPDGTTLATNDDSNNFTVNNTTINISSKTYLWNTTTRKITATLTDPHSQGINEIAFAPGGTTLATADISGNIYLWNTTTRKITTTLTDADNFTIPNTLTFGPGGTTLATGDLEGSIYLWNTTTGKLTTTLTDPHRGTINGTAFAPGGTTLATADISGNIYLWNTTTRKVTATLTDPDSYPSVNAVAFSPDGTTLATADVNGSTYLWHVSRPTQPGGTRRSGS